MALIVTGWGCSNGCVVAVAIYPTSTGSYRETNISFFSEWFRLQRLDGRLLFVGGDSWNFECAFTACAFSAWPLRVEAFEGGRLVNVSGDFPALIAADAKSQWRSYLAVPRPRHPPLSYYLDVVGDLAAWAADECRLGDGADAWEVLRRTVGKAQFGLISPVRTSLVKWSYCTSGPPW